ncbi:MAG: hypothetical protein INH41_03860 [Myxococcaceae bacterium]|jgi:hypothetical protein|nr:hypothetical protein [Myxococcaceae bacterium]MCA3011516.1 hypothetical protein [Myxococcaceae bacterium]
MLLPELQILTSKPVEAATVVAWLTARYPSSRVHVGDEPPADAKWTIWLRVDASGHRDWPCVIVLAFTQERSIVGPYPEFELATHLGGLGLDCLVPPRDLVKGLPASGGWTFAWLAGAWHLVDFRGDDAGLRGFFPDAGPPRPVALDVTRLGAGCVGFPGEVKS